MAQKAAPSWLLDLVPSEPNLQGGSMVSGMSQRKALNDTALGTANWLVFWGQRIKAEMKKQNIGRHAKRTPLSDRKFDLMMGRYTTDDKETIIFERGEIRRLLDEMAERVHRLRRFEKPLAKVDDTDD
jgi:hypothetical protein